MSVRDELSRVGYRRGNRGWVKEEGQEGPRNSSTYNGQEGGYRGQELGHGGQETEGREAKYNEKEKMYRRQDVRILGTKVRKREKE